MKLFKHKKVIIALALFIAVSIPLGITFADTTVNNLERRNIKSGTTITLPKNTPTKTGYTFNGYKLDGDTSGIIYQAGAKVTVNSDMHFTAQWQALKITMPSSAWWTSITYGNGKFVAVSDAASGTSQSAAYSYDGINWTRTTMPISAMWKSVTYGNSKFVAVGYTTNSHVIAYSVDGITWNMVETSINFGTTVVFYANDKFVTMPAGVTDFGHLGYSYDGINWTKIPISGYYKTITYGNGKFVALGREGRTIYSEDGIEWTEGTTLKSSYSNTTWDSITYGNGKFVAVGTEISYSVDGINWTNITRPTRGTLSSVTYGNGVFVAVGSGYDYYDDTTTYSYDGINWIKTTMPSFGNYEAVIYSNGRFVTIGHNYQSNGTQAAYSINGINWTDEQPTAYEWATQTTP